MDACLRGVVLPMACALTVLGVLAYPCGCGQGRALLRRRFSRRQDDVVLVGYKDQEYDSDDQREVDDEDDCCLTNEYAWPLAWCATERL